MIKQLAGVTYRLIAVVTAGTGWGLSAAVYKGLNPLRTSRHGLYAATITTVKGFFLEEILWSCTSSNKSSYTQSWFDDTLRFPLHCPPLARAPLCLCNPWSILSVWQCLSCIDFGIGFLLYVR